jgi:hypothetical protein
MPFSFKQIWRRPPQIRAPDLEESRQFSRKLQIVGNDRECDRSRLEREGGNDLIAPVRWVTLEIATERRHAGWRRNRVSQRRDRAVERSVSVSTIRQP